MSEEVEVVHTIRLTYCLLEFRYPNWILPPDLWCWFCAKNLDSRVLCEFFFLFSVEFASKLMIWWGLDACCHSIAMWMEDVAWRHTLSGKMGSSSLATWLSQAYAWGPVLQGLQNSLDLWLLRLFGGTWCLKVSSGLGSTKRGEGTEQYWMWITSLDTRLGVTSALISPWADTHGL